MKPVLPPVLILDDEKNMRLSLQTVLTDEGYAVTAVESAEAALKLLEREKFLMAIADAHLGGMTGYEFLARVRPAWPDMPVLIITAYATPKLAVGAIKAGAMDYLSNPSSPKSCCIRWPGARNVIDCCRRTRSCAPVPAKSWMSSRSSANAPR